jgi:hypothetical protein
LYQFFIAEITHGNSQFTLLTNQSKPSSPKNKKSEIFSSFWISHSLTKKSTATAIGRSKLVHTFLRSDGDKFKTILWFGNEIHTFLKVALILSFASLTVASGSQIISIVGKDLFISASTIISYHSSHKLLNVLIFCIHMFI